MCEVSLTNDQIDLLAEQISEWVEMHPKMSYGVAKDYLIGFFGYLNDLQTPKEIVVNGFAVADGLSGVAVGLGSYYYVPDPSVDSYFSVIYWKQEFDYLLKRGLVYPTEAKAIARAKAMLGINPYES